MPEITRPLPKRYYPKLSDIITVEDLPDFLSFAETGLTNLLDRVHYKNLHCSKSYHGDSAFYSLEIVSRNLGLELPFGLRLVLNPDVDGNNNISAFPVSVEYQWEILAFLHSFNLQNFTFSPQSLFELGLRIFKVSEEQLIAHVLNYFVELEDGETSPFVDLLEAINTVYPEANLVLPDSEEPTVDNVAGLIRQNVHIPQNISALMFTLYISDGDLEQSRRNLQQFYQLMVPDGMESYIQHLIKPHAKATLTVSAGIEFPNNVLKPVTADGTPIPNTKSLFKFGEATLYADTDAGIGYQADLTGSLLPEFNQIGNTGLTIGFTNAKLDLSRTSNIPEANAAGYAPDFVGLYVQHATIGFTRFGKENAGRTSAAIIADNLLIGTGGISGTLALASDGALYRDFGKFAAELTSFSLTFRQNAIVNSAISGKLTIPGFQMGGQAAVIDIQAFIRENGDFSITAQTTNALPVLTLLNVFELKLRTLEVGWHDEHYYIAVSGELDFIADLPVLGSVLPKGIQIQKLLIWDNGALEFEGGGLQVPKAFRLQVGPVKLEVSNMSLGSYSKKLHDVDRQYRFFGFDGMINTGRAGVNATGNGIKYYFTTDNEEGKPFDHYISIDSIAVDMTIPGNVGKDKASFILNGYLSVANPSLPGSVSATEYTGSVSFAMPKLKLAGSAGMRLAPDIPAFIVDIGLDLGTPVPLGGTGLGIYGFRGLIGQHYVPAKSATSPPVPENGTWWDYYKTKSALPPYREGIEIDKFANKDGYSVGAGVSIATSFDSGFTFSSKLFLLLGLPDVFLLQGQAGILRGRIGLQDDVDPPFSALIAIDNQSFTGNLAVDYNLPESGNFKGGIFALQGSLDLAFYFNNASGWHLNIGKDRPDNERVRARVLSLFQASSYVMLSAQGIKAGADARFDLNKSFGPFGLEIGAFIGLGGHISFKPVQIGGYINFGGSAAVRISRFKLSIGIAIGLAVEAPRPFNVVGSLEIKVKIIFFSVKFKGEFRLGHRDDNMDLLLAPIPVLQLPSGGYLPAVATNIMSNETFEVNYVSPGSQGEIPAPNSWHKNFDDAIVPLDSFIDIELLKPVKPGAWLGGASNQLPDGFSELLPPEKGVNDQVRHEYALTGLEIMAWVGTPENGEWVSYQIYEAVTAIADANTGPGAVQLAQLKPGYWQFSDKNKYNKIRLLSQNMFSYMNGSTNTTFDLDALNFQKRDLFCFDRIAETVQINWKEEAADTVYASGEDIGFQGLVLRLSGLHATVDNAAQPFQSLLLNGQQGSLHLQLPEPVSYLQLAFGACQHPVKVDYIHTSHLKILWSMSLPLLVSVKQDILQPGQTGSQSTYDQRDYLIDQIVIHFNEGPVMNYEGDLQFGGHLPLPDQFATPELAGGHRYYEQAKSLLEARLYNTAIHPGAHFTGREAFVNNIVGEWPLSGQQDVSAHHLDGMLSGNPDTVPGYYTQRSDTLLLESPVYTYLANEDALLIPFRPALQVENDSFAFEVTAVFNPFKAGISTLVTKISEDAATGHRKGYALHLCRADADPDQQYTDTAAIPSYTVWFTCYHGSQQWGTKLTGKYTVNCSTGSLLADQYKNILVSVDRSADRLYIYLDKVLVHESAMPEPLAVFSNEAQSSHLQQVSYMTEGIRTRLEKSGISHAAVIDEVQILSDTLNKTIQPVWRPDTTYAVKLTTEDRVTYRSSSTSYPGTHIFGFRTAGPVGHFHQHNPQYQQLAAQDRADEFKLAGLKHYIDYERSFPDAQSRYDLSKPVFYHDPQVKLFFKQPYINAMFADWHNYHNLPEVKSRLELQILDTFNQTYLPQLIWQEEKSMTVTDINSLPPDQRIIYQLNQAVVQGSCVALPAPIQKKLKQGSYQFPDLQPGKLYTALLTAIYQTGNAEPVRSEVYKFNFKTSRFASFEEQAGSFVQKDASGHDVYAVQTRNVSFTADELNGRLKKLINDSVEDDPEDTLHYAVPFDRVVYGGLQFTEPESRPHTVITLIRNSGGQPTDTAHIIGILITNPEPFNEPKLEESQREDTIQLRIATANASYLPADFRYIHARDTSAVLITNEAMDMPLGEMHFTFLHKVFNGVSYESSPLNYKSPVLDMTTYL